MFLGGKFIQELFLSLHRKAQGYPEGNYTMESKLPVTDYVNSENHWQLLANCTQVGFTVVMWFNSCFECSSDKNNHVAFNTHVNYPGSGTESGGFCAPLFGTGSGRKKRIRHTPSTIRMLPVILLWFIIIILYFSSLLNNLTFSFAYCLRHVIPVIDNFTGNKQCFWCSK